MFSLLIRKYACSGISTWTPSGTYTNDPPDQTAEFSAASLLSFAGMTVAKYLRTDVVVLAQCRVHVGEDHALLLESSGKLVVHDL